MSSMTSSEGSVEAQPKHAGSASEHPAFPHFDKADFGYVVESFHGEGNAGPIFAVPQVALKGAKGPSWHRDFQPAGFDETGVFILCSDWAVFHCRKGRLPGMVVAAHCKSLLHAACGGTGGQQADEEEDAEKLSIHRSDRVSLIRPGSPQMAGSRHAILEVRGHLNQKAVPIYRIIGAGKVSAVKREALGILLGIELPVELEHRILNRSVIETRVSTALTLDDSLRRSPRLESDRQCRCRPVPSVRLP